MVRELDDPNVARVVDAWPDLPEHIKSQIMTLVESTHNGSGMDSGE